MTGDGPAQRSGASMLRRAIVGVIVVSFGLAALGGIVVLLGGELGDAGFRVLGTTAVIGAFSVAVLCCATLVGRRLQVFGLAGAVISVVAAGLVVTVIWWQGEYSDTLWRLMWTATAASVAVALASLLLLLADRDQPAVRLGLVVTLGLFAVVLVMVVVLVWASEAVSGDGYTRVLGIASILAALGAVVVPVISLLLRGRARGGLSDASRTRIEAEASRRGVTPDELVATLLGAESPVSAPPPAGREAENARDTSPKAGHA